MNKKIIIGAFALLSLLGIILGAVGLTKDHFEDIYKSRDYIPFDKVKTDIDVTYATGIVATLFGTLGLLSSGYLFYEIQFNNDDLESGWKKNLFYGTAVSALAMIMGVVALVFNGKIKDDMIDAVKNARTSFFG